MDTYFRSCDTAAGLRAGLACKLLAAAWPRLSSSLKAPFKRWPQGAPCNPDRHPASGTVCACGGCHLQPPTLRNGIASYKDTGAHLQRQPQSHREERRRPKHTAAPTSKAPCKVGDLIAALLSHLFHECKPVSCRNFAGPTPWCNWVIHGQASVRRPLLLSAQQVH